MRSCAPFSCWISSRPSPLPLCARLPLCMRFSAFSSSATCRNALTCWRSEDRLVDSCNLLTPSVYRSVSRCCL